jgi:NAD(P)-dependent dehydrogenase (short-subunit alcohol dehydrogenase family)
VTARGGRAGPVALVAGGSAGLGRAIAVVRANDMNVRTLLIERQ